MMHTTFKGEVILATVLLIVFVLGFMFLVPSSEARKPPGLTTVAVGYAPPTGSKITIGSPFTMYANIGCFNIACRGVSATISFSPSAGLSVASGSNTISVGNIAQHDSTPVSWSVNSNAAGTYKVTVTVTSSNAAGSTNNIAVIIIPQAYKSCSDSDGEYTWPPASTYSSDLHTLGTVSGSDPNNQPYTYSDTCNGDVLSEWFCYDTNPSVLQQNCLAYSGTYHCANGACIS